MKYTKMGNSGLIYWLFWLLYPG